MTARTLYSVALSATLGLLMLVAASGADEVLRPRAAFAPRFEKNGGSFHAVAAAPDGRFYLAGAFSSLDGTPRTGVARFLADGSLDPTFTPPDLDAGTVRALALQPDGRLIIGGTFRRVGTTARGGIARLLPDGALDPTFATGEGITETAAIHTIALQSNGWVMIGGRFFGFDAFATRGVARLYADGSVDTSFVAPDLDVFEVNAIIVRGDGRVVIGGITYPASVLTPFVAQLLADGGVDPEFATGAGFTKTSFSYNAVNALLADTGNRIIVGGGFTAYQGTARGQLVRLNDDGSLDASFNNGTGFSGGSGSEGTVNGVTALARQPDGAILVTGTFTSFDGTPRHHIARLTAAGALDASFDPEGANGPAQFSGGSLRSVAVLPGGDIVAAGNFVLFPDILRNRLFRFSPTGAVDADVDPRPRSPGAVLALLADAQGGFIAGGDFTHVDGEPRGSIARLAAGGSLDVSYAAGISDGFNGVVHVLAAGPGDTVYAGGDFDLWGTTASGHVARLTSEGTLDSEFAVGDGFNAPVRALAVLDDGRVLAGGEFQIYQSVDRQRVALLAADGSLDPGFTPGDLIPGTVHALLVQDDRRILLGGYFQTLGTDSRASLARLNADGSLDATFGNGAGGFYSNSPGVPAGTVLHLLSGPAQSFYALGDFAAYHDIGAVITTAHNAIRLDADGSVDPAFDFGAGLNFGAPHAALALPDGRLIVSGSFPLLQDQPVPGLARILPTGELDPTFLPPAPLEPVYAPDNAAFSYRALALTGDGDLVAAGSWLRFADLAMRGVVQFEPSPAPVIVLAPAEQIAQPGDDVTFAVTATGTNLTYQWFHDGTGIDGATGATLGLTDVDWTDAGAYTVAITDGYSTVVTDPVLLRGPNPVPVITTQPGVADVIAGGAATLAVAVDGTGPFTYHWRRGGALLATATAATLALPNVTMSEADWYDVVVADGMSVATSQAGRVIVRPTGYSNAYRANPVFAPRFEHDGGIVNRVAAAPDGTFYLGGNFSSIGAHPSSGLARFLVDGTVDTTFQVDGFAEAHVHVIMPLADGTVLVGGEFSHVGGRAAGGIVRLLADGRVDPAFDPRTGFDGRVVDLAVDGEGRIVVIGFFNTFNGVPRKRISRLLPDGSLDESFVVGTGFSANVDAVAAYPDGRVLVGGPLFDYNGTSVRTLVRLLENGALDPSFVMASNDATALNAICVQPDGRILIGGWFLEIGGVAHRHLARLNANGTRDPAFTPPLGFNENVRAIMIEPNGRIVATGPYWVGTTPHGSITRFLSNGTLDTSFVPPNATVRVFDGARVADGRFVIAATLAPGSSPPYVEAALLEADGARDTSFMPTTRQPATPATILPVADGKWLVGGDFLYVDGADHRNLVRLNSDGAIDETFATGSGFDAAVYALTPAGNDAVIAGGRFTTYQGELSPLLARLLPDGARDPDFDPAIGTAGWVIAAATRPDGRIWVGGTFPPDGELPGALVRLRADGAIDDAFAAGIGMQHTYTTIGPFPTTITDQGAVHALEPTAAGGIVAGGAFSRYAGSARDGIVRIEGDGSLDVTFDPGAGFHALTSGSGIVLHLAQLPDGRMLAAGEFASYDGSNPGSPVRLSTDGKRDGDFALPTGTPGGYALLPQGDGKLIVSTIGPDLIRRFESNGQLDEGFHLAYAPTGFAWPPGALAFREDGAVVMAGPWVQLGAFTGRGLVLIEPAQPPVIEAGPQPQTTTAGGATTLSVEASGEGTLTYQWQRLQPASGPASASAAAEDTWIDIPGATGASYTIPSTQAFHRGTYRVMVTAEGVSIASDPVVVTVVAAPPSPARLLNLSTRGLSATDPDVLIPGFVVSGTANKRVLIRAVGPTLGLEPINLAGVLVPDPVMTLKRYNATTETYEDLTSNDDWGTNPNAGAIATTAAELFAFELKDENEAALLMDLAPGQYTVIASDKASAPGLAIVELYDADASGVDARLINISNRGYCGVGDEVMIPGFVVSHEGPKTLLVRVVGPTLAHAPYNVPGTMTDPRLQLFRKEVNGSDTLLLSQDNWNDNPDAANTRQTADDLGAFALDEGSADAAFVVTLPPGTYTVVGSSSDGTSTGVVLVEVYVVE